MIVGPTKLRKCRSMVLWFFVNISRLEKDQRFRFGYMAVFGLLKIFNGLDHHLWSRNLKKMMMQKSPCHVLYSGTSLRFRPASLFQLSPFPMLSVTDVFCLYPFPNGGHYSTYLTIFLPSETSFRQ